MSVRRSLFLTYGAQGAVFLVGFASSVVIARLVTPRDYGILAMATAVTSLINVFMQFGLAKYIMRAADVSRDILRTLFTVNLAMTLLYCALIVSAGTASGLLFGSWDVGRFLLVFAIFPLVTMMEFIPSALAAREMRFGLISALAVMRAVLQAGLTIALAAVGFAYMSFAWALIITYALSAIAFNVAIWRPEVWRPRLEGAREIARFGFQMIGIGGINQVNTRFGEMTLGSLLGLASLGLYTRAANLPALLYSNVFGLGSNVIFARMSNELHDRGEFHDIYLRFVRLLLALLWPMMIGVAVLAQPIIPLLYGAKWQEAATPLSLLMVGAAMTVAIGMTTEVFILRHRTKDQLRIETFRALFGYLAFAAGAMVSLTLAAAAKIGEALFAFLLYRKPMDRLVGGPTGALRRAYAEGVLVTLVAVGPALLLMLWSGFSPSTPIPLIALAIVMGVAGWALLLIRLRHPLFLEAARLVRIRR